MSDHTIVIDELHRHKTRQLIKALESARQALKDFDRAGLAVTVSLQRMAETFGRKS